LTGCKGKPGGGLTGVARGVEGGKEVSVARGVEGVVGTGAARGAKDGEDAGWTPRMRTTPTEGGSRAPMGGSSLLV
jgi:hypothetical protein